MVRAYVNIMTTGQRKVTFERELGGKLTELCKSWMRGIKESKVHMHPEVPDGLSEYAMAMLSNLCPLPSPGEQ